jgi:hypothetical protein
MRIMRQELRVMGWSDFDQSFDASLLYKNRLCRTVGLADIAASSVASVSWMQRGGNRKTRR